MKIKLILIPVLIASLLVKNASAMETSVSISPAGYYIHVTINDKYSIAETYCLKNFSAIILCKNNKEDLIKIGKEIINGKRDLDGQKVIWNGQQTKGDYYDNT